MAHRDPAVRALYASVAGLTRWAKETDPAAATSAARAAFGQKFLDQVPADLPEHERLRRADMLRRAHFKRLAAKSVAARRKPVAPKTGAV